MDKIERVFPKTDSPGFIKHAVKEWSNLQGGKHEGQFTMSSQLRNRLKQKRGRLINKFTIFIVWIILCLERPWENQEFKQLSIKDIIEDGQIKAWRFNLTEKSGENIWNRIDKILNQILDDYPDNFQLRTLRNHLNKGKLRSAIVAHFIGIEQFGVLGRALYEYLNPIRLLAKSIGQLFTPEFIQAAQIFAYIKKEKYVKKRDLIRKFGITGERCDCLLNYLKAEDMSYLKILDSFPNKSVWIVYNGP